MDSSESRSAVVLELAEEFLDRYRRGQRPSLKEYADRHPELAVEIRDVFPAMAMMENIALGDESLEGDTTGAAPRARPPSLERLGDFRILREVGHGGMGIVYEAEQVSLGRHVALKVLPRTMVRDARQIVRFEREARAAAKLHHTNIVPVFGVGEQDGTPYYVMQFIAGLGLDAVIDELRQLRTAGGATPGMGHRMPPRDVTAAAAAQSLLTGRFEPGVEDESPGLGLAVTLARTETGPLATTDPGRSDTPRPVSGLGASSKGSISEVSVASSSVFLPGRGTDARSGRQRPATYWQSVARVGVQVAEALDYAHKQGVVHRDVKPSNLLLDARGTVWVTDFGLAKAGDQHDLTHTGDILGTLRYMPPEAFEGKSDSRGDIYSLGLTLYEMLAFRPAYEERDRNRLIKRVTGEEPPRLRSLNPEVPRDLETIVHKAIDRDPDHRYSSSGELAADLQRYLEDEPILARRATPMERCRRWYRRNRVVASLAATLIGVLALATIGSLIGLARVSRLAEREAAARLVADQQKDAAVEARRHEAEHRRLAEESRLRAEAALQDARVQRDRAEANFARARAAVDDYLTRVSESRLLQVPGMQPLRRDLLQSALGFYRDFLKERGNDPTIRAGLAAAHLRVGKILREFGQWNEAKSAYQQARDLYRALLDRVPDDRESRGGLAEALDGAGEPDEAIAIWERLVRDAPDPARYQQKLADAYNMRAVGQSAVARSLEWHLKALPLREALVRRDPGDPRAQLDLGGTLNNLGVVLSKQDQKREALAMYERAVEHSRLAYEKSPQDILYGRFYAIGLKNVGGMRWDLGEREAALRWLQEANDLARRLAAENPSVPYLQSYHYQYSRELGSKLRELGKADEAARLMRQARAALERLPSRTPDDLFNLACARALCAAATPGGDKTPGSEDDLRERLRMADLAVAALRKAFDLGFRDVEKLKGDDDLKAIRDRDDFKKLVARADLEERARKAEELARADGTSPDRKLAHNREALEARERLAAADPKDRRLRGDIAASQQAIGLIQLGLDRLDEARAALERARSLREGLAREDPRDDRSRTDLASTTIALGKLEWKAGRLAEAERLWRDGEDRWARAESQSPESLRDPRGLADARREIGEEYARRGLWALAAPLTARAFESQPIDQSSLCRRAAMLALGAGDEAAYRRLCASGLDRLAKSTGSPTDIDLGWTLVMAPGGIGDPARALKLIGTTEPDQRPWYNHALALALYRCGRFEEAVRRIHQCYGRRGEEWGACGLDESLLAMALHRLGREDEARRALEDAEAIQARTARVIFERDGSIPGHWSDWADALALRREAAQLIRGKPGPDPPLATLAAARLYAKLGRTDLAEAGFRAAVEAAPDDPDVWLARSEVFAGLGHRDRSEADLARAAALTSADPMPWIRHGRWLAERGDRDGADAAFARAATATPDELNRFLEAGWWVVGPYPESLTTPCPPELDPDPARTVASADGAAAPTWRPIATGEYGRVDLRAVFNADHISAYALTYVYSPDERTATLMVGGDDRVRVWLNGRPVHETVRYNVDWINLDDVPVTLRAGKNTLLVKVSQGNGPHSLVLRLADNPLDRAERFVAMGLWREAAEQYEKALRGRPSENPVASYRYAALLRAAGEADRCRRFAEAVFERHRSVSDAGVAHPVAMICDLAPEARVDFARLAELDEQCADFVKRRDGNTNDYFWAALTWLRAGRFEHALGLAREFRGENAFKSSLLALIHHGLGRSEEARRALADADQTWEALMRSAAAADGSASSRGPAGYDLIMVEVLRREARARIEGTDPGEDPRYRAYQDRVRDRLEHLDRATADYDRELMFDPGRVRLWLARGRRLAELGRWGPADADLDKAVELGKDDPRTWAERGRIFAEWGRPDRAADDLARALDLAETASEEVRDAIASDLASRDAVYDRVAPRRPGDRRLREWRIRQLARCGLWDRAALVAGTIPEADPYDRIAQAGLLILAGDRDGYRRACREALDLDRRSDDAKTLVLADRPGILAPDALDEHGLAIEMAERALEGNLPDAMNWPGCTLYVLGAAHYRAGNDEQAVRACRRSLEEYPGWFGKVLNWPVLALAYHRLGDAEEARKALDQAWKLAGRTRRGRFDAGSFLAESHLYYLVNGLELMIWLREAEAVILDDPAFPADPFATRS
jgi:tetratricopeptide (TPR) repeat protein